MQNQLLYTDNTVKENVAKIPTKLNDMAISLVDKMKELLIAAIVLIISLYLLRAVGLYVMSKKEGHSFSWLAFVPFGCFFSYGFITGKTKLFGIEVDHAWAVLPALLLSSTMPYVGSLSTILFVLAYLAMLYRIYQLKSPNFAVVLLILSILIPILPPIILFAIRNK